MTIGMDDRDWFYSDVDVGDVAILVKRENILTGKKSYYLAPDHGGICSNLNSEVKRYHGWRGTTDNIRIEAMGLRQIIAAHICKNGRVRVWLSRDLYPDVD